MLLAQPAAAGIEEALKALQAADLSKAEKELQVLAKERDPRAEFLLGVYVYGNPDPKNTLHDFSKAVPLLLDAAERGYTNAIIPLATLYADGSGVTKNAYEAYKWLLIGEHWNVPNASQVREQMTQSLGLSPAEIEKAKAEANAFTFKLK
jgi:hypothetical protein